MKIEKQVSMAINQIKIDAAFARLQSIDPSKESLKFLSKRIRLDDYRGVQISQHNRYDYNQVLEMIKELDRISKDDFMQIRTTDLSKRPNNEKGEERYA